MSQTLPLAIKSLLSLVLVMAAVLISLTIASAQTAPTAPTPSAAIVPIGPNDSLNITVIGEAELTNTYIVDPNGDISLPYAGKIHVGGLSLDAATTLIQAKLAQIYTDPQVTVTRPAVGGISVYITGSVAKQGQSQLRRDAHLNDLIQLSGPTTDADLTHIAITSGEPGQPHSTATYDLTTFLNAGADTGNPALSDGDQVFVPKLTSESVSIIGYVTKPGRYNVQPGETVFELISDAGGLTAAADPSGTYLKEMGSDTHTPFNFITAAQNPSDPALNPVLKDGDEVVVPLTASVPSYALLGAFVKAGEYPIRGQVSFLDAIAIADGFEDHAQLKKTVLTRITSKGPEVINLDAGDTKKMAVFYLQAGDVITVPHGGGQSQFNVFNVFGLLGTILGLGKL